MNARRDIVIPTEELDAMHVSILRALLSASTPSLAFD